MVWGRDDYAYMEIIHQLTGRLQLGGCQDLLLGHYIYIVSILRRLRPTVHNFNGLKRPAVDTTIMPICLEITRHETINHKMGYSRTKEWLDLEFILLSIWSCIAIR